MSNFYKTPWLEQDKAHRTSIFKRAIYLLTRPLLSFYGKSFLDKETLTKLKPSIVLPGRGMPLETRRKWGSALCKIRESVILVQGTGTGWDVISWAKLRPKKIIATDLFEFQDSWKAISSYCLETFGVKVDFHQASLEDHSFIASSSIDLCVSDAVFEHCTDLSAVLRESFRVLKPGGSLYAGYGPLWFAAGGDHFSGRGGLENAFNHVQLNQQEYEKYFRKFLEPNEDFQSGGRYVELDLFSKLTTQEYIHCFKTTGFLVNSLILEVSPTSLLFKKKFPTQFRSLLEKWSNKCKEEDFLINANLIRLLKPT